MANLYVLLIYATYMYMCIQVHVCVCVKIVYIYLPVFHGLGCMLMNGDSIGAPLKMVLPPHESSNLQPPSISLVCPP